MISVCYTYMGDFFFVEPQQRTATNYLHFSSPLLPPRSVQVLRLLPDTVARADAQIIGRRNTRSPRRSPVHLRMDGKSLNLVVHVVSFFSGADRCAQFDDREVIYSENGAVATTSAKLGDVYPSTYRTPKSRTMFVKGGLRLPASHVAKALFECVFKCQARKFD